MRPANAIPLLVALGLGAPGIARAEGWYLYWDCVGQCDGYGAGNMGHFGPYASEDDCDYAMHHSLVIPDDSLFRYYCYYEAPEGGSTSSNSGPVYVPGPSTEPEVVTLTSIEFSVLGGPGWTARDDVGSTAGQGTVGFDFEARTGPRYFGGSLQLGVQGTRLDAPLFGDKREEWFVAPGGIGLVLSPRLFSVGEGSFWLDGGASLVGFLAFGCDDCAAPVFAKNWGAGYALRAGFDVMFSEDAGLSLELVLPRYHLGNAAPGDLLLTSPGWLVRLAVVGRPPEGIEY